jgi:hypothetical protein
VINIDLQLGFDSILISRDLIVSINLPNHSTCQSIKASSVNSPEAIFDKEPSIIAVIPGSLTSVGQTKPPARYNEGALIKAMKNAHQFVTDVNLKKILRGDEGIGTSAILLSFQDP